MLRVSARQYDGRKRRGAGTPTMALLRQWHTVARRDARAASAESVYHYAESVYQRGELSKVGIPQREGGVPLVVLLLR